MPLTLEDTFRSAIRLEESAKAVYEHWQALFGDRPEVCEFWNEYVQDEKHHAQLLEATRSKLTPERLQEPIDRRVEEGIGEAQAFFSHLHVDVDTLDDALALAGEIENSEINSVLEFILTHFAPEAATRAMIHAQLREHIDRLNLDSPTHILGKTPLTIKAAR